MKKVFVILLGMVLLLSGCSSYGTAQGAYAGAGFGRVIGSAIGGISNGWRGHEVGSLIGTVGGAVVGGVIGSAVEKQQQRETAEQRIGRHMPTPKPADSGYDPQERGDDRIAFTHEVPALEIRNASIYETDNDGVLTRGEECTVVLDIVNNTNERVFNVCPFVEDVTGNKHVFISPNLRIESIGPRQGIRYSATIQADRRLKDGEIVIRVGVNRELDEVVSQTRQFVVPTAKIAPRR